MKDNMYIIINKRLTDKEQREAIARIMFKAKLPSCSKFMYEIRFGYTSSEDMFKLIGCSVCEGHGIPLLEGPVYQLEGDGVKELEAIALLIAYDDQSVTKNMFNSWVRTYEE